MYDQPLQVADVHGCELLADWLSCNAYIVNHFHPTNSMLKRHDRSIMRQLVQQVADVRGCELLADWLSCNAITSERVDHFPKRMLETHGRLAIEAIETMSGKKVKFNPLQWYLIIL